jgi:hypothetical protein
MADGPSGYETLKAAFKNSHKIETATIGLTGSVNDNQKELVKVSSTFKLNEEEHLFSGVISVNSEKVNKNYTLFGSKDGMVFKDDASNVYNRIETKNEFKGKRFKNRNHNVKESVNPQLEAIGEKIMDTLVGDLKKQVEQKELENGDKQISINLDKNEIPSLVNLILSAKRENECENVNKADKMHEILGINPEDCKMPELTNNVQAENIDVQLVVDKNNVIKELDAEFDVTGYDDQNQFHSQELKLGIDVSDINSTKVDTINLDGKEVREITHREFECNRD